MIYTQLKEKYAVELAKSISMFNVISIMRLSIVILFLLSVYFYTSTVSEIWLAFIFISAAVFSILLYFHDRIKRKKEIFNALFVINKEEEAFIGGNQSFFEKGEDFIVEHHPYAYDVDVLGDNSLYQHLCRAKTFPGKRRLAEVLLNSLDDNEILQNQDAIKELQGKLEFRQNLTAMSDISRDSEKMYTNILKWAEQETEELPVFIRILSFLMPIILFCLIIYYFISWNESLPNVIGYVFLINLGILYSQMKKIRLQIMGADRVNNALKQYANILKVIDSLDFESLKLKELKNLTVDSQSSAGQKLDKLSVYFSNLEAIQNLLGAVIFNGFFLYHLHNLHGLIKWKKNNSSHLKKWLDVIGEIEMLSSLANFAYNNPSYCFPEINNQFIIRFEDLGHPLLSSYKRVNNSVDFTEKPFVILTGSNMSGKSTFLRSVAVNLILAGTGSVVCASKANVHVLPLFVSMRLSDSLADSESYFYAEIKRLHEIMLHLDKQRAFVLLDEILRGTNSDDKRNGTVGVLRKLVNFKAIGAIATHDLEVCNTKDDYPEYLSNKCFEAEIENGNLHFDYKLREGISKNKSASFLMKKMEIIE